jgi:hypothetical protein
MGALEATGNIFRRACIDKPMIIAAQCPNAASSDGEIASEDHKLVHTAFQSRRKRHGNSCSTPKGLQGSAQGFNPGNHQNKRFALKGREASR